jgi:hypothetical protein
MRFATMCGLGTGSPASSVYEFEVNVALLIDGNPHHAKTLVGQWLARW